MRIGIDARFYGSVGKGLGRYTQKMIENLENISLKEGAGLGCQNQYYILLRKENFDDYRPKSQNFHKILADYPWYSLAEQIKVPQILNKLDLDLAHFPHFNVPIFYRKKFIVTIHDLILLHFPTLRGTLLNPIFFYFKYLAYRFVINSALKRAQKVITVSEFTKNDVIRHYPFTREKIVVTYEACDGYCWVGDSDKILAKYGIMKPYLLYVGNAYPHKNLDRLINAFQQVKKSIGGISLIMVGKEDYFYRHIKKYSEAKGGKGIIFTGFVPDQELDVLYRESSVFVFPSLYEGFGLPPLEAMAKGVPVVSSDHPCMQEILGTSALFCDARKEERLARAITQCLGNQDLRKRLIEDGYRQSQNFSWHELAKKTEKIYRDIGE